MGSYDYTESCTDRVFCILRCSCGFGRQKSQLDPEDREWILSDEAAELDKHHLTMTKNFIDELGNEWETKKSPFV